ncbi:MAG: ATP-binding protein [bacterium]|nr:ATP-binding protein [bacterium]
MEAHLAPHNPFSPTFGASPPVLAGRDHIIEDIGDALVTGPSHPDYTALLIGVSGSGKTAMLNAVEDLARSHGWLVLADNAAPEGLPARLARGASRLLNELSLPEPRRRITSLTAAGFGIGFERSSTVQPGYDLRGVLSALGDVLATGGTGLMISLDELQSGDLDEIREFGSVLQHVTRREQRPVAFVGAGLPQIEESLLSGDAATFLQRCSRHDIDRLDPEATRLAIARPIADRGGRIDPQALGKAIAATSGYAFMVQLVGFHSWKAAGTPVHIGVDDVEVGISEARRRVGRLVLAPTWNALSNVDRRFLLAMATDDDESRLAEIAARLGVSTNYAGVYRRRLINAGMIITTGKGRVALAHHAARDWLRDQAKKADYLS